MTNSDVASATYTIQAQQQVATPTFSPAGGDVHRIGDGDDQHRDERRDDPLHDRRQHADDVVADLHRADHRVADHDDSSVRHRCTR